MSEWFDVAVVGVGPAGAAAALRTLQLRPQARVLLLDAAAPGRDKTCGDGMAAPVFDLLDALEVPGVGQLGRAVPGVQVRSPSGRVVSASCARVNRVIPRREFDATLVAAAVARGAVLRRQRVRRLRMCGDGVVLDSDTAAAVVIGADGANSCVRRALGAPPTPAGAQAIAVRGYTSTPAVDPDALVISFTYRHHRPAYAWSFPLADGRANAGYGVFHRGKGASKQELIERLGEQLPGQELDPDTVRGHHLPLSTGGRFQPDGRVLLAGDAAAMVNPLTGEGIYDALSSGALAGQAALHGAAAGARHRQALRRCFARHHRHTATLARLMDDARFLDAAIAAAGTHRYVFETLSELGMTRGTLRPAALAVIAAAYLHTPPTDPAAAGGSHHVQARTSR